MPTAQYMREYRARQRHTGPTTPTSQRKRGRPPVEDRKVLVQLRLKTSLLGRLTRIYEEGLVHGTHRWQSKSQMMADLIVRGLETYSNDEHVAELLPFLRAAHQVDSIGSRRREFQSHFSHSVAEVNAMLDIGAADQAVYTYHAIRRDVQQLPESVWRDWFLREWRTKFKKLADTPLPNKFNLGADDDEDKEMPTSASARRVKKPLDRTKARR